jgi:hypothetical protein
MSVVSTQPVLKVSVVTAFDASVVVHIEGAKVSGHGLPNLCRSGERGEATFVAATKSGKAQNSADNNGNGTIQISGLGNPVVFNVALSSGQAGGATSWVGSKGRFKQTVLNAPKWDWREAGPKPTEGKAADVELSDFKNLRINVRAMTAMELKRTAQLQALQESMKETDYDSLRAQITKARMASVELAYIEQAEVVLKEMKEKGLHVNEGCDKDTLREALLWSRVTSTTDMPGVFLDEPCDATASDCECNVDHRRGEELQLNDGEIQECLKKFGPEADKLLFEEISASALAVEDGCVWKAGGKFILSEFNRNQSYTSLVRMLVKHGKHRAAEMFTELVQHTEAKYGGYVSAIQVNVHPHGGTSHNQHRDIYSMKQSAGPNCTCQFQPAVGTVCYTLGSSRLVQLNTIADKMSNIEACCEGCKGRKVQRWLHSGNAMYFNIEWNNNHLHGIPAMPSPYLETNGPRISLAFLLAASPTRSMQCAI